MVIEVRGVVQGVGFRPFVHNLATSLGLCGFVQNRGTHVLIDVEGDPAAVSTFRARLPAGAPPRASVEAIETRSADPARHHGFAIRDSDVLADRDVRVSADIATCDACLDELLEPANRRFRYPFITCSWCGPRFTITTGVPYDRARTTMARFTLCEACRGEYEDPTNRRFHAESIACARCGPSVRTGDGRHAGERALAAAVDALRAGRIVAVKGLGGYHLACDATSAAAVATLRARKRRDAKPLAVMVPVEAARRLPHGAVRDALLSPQRPIVLVARELWRGAGGPPLADDVAPGCPAVGILLPYTPLHHLLLHDTALPLVMTSGNQSDEPIAFDDDDARDRLAAIADVSLVHDRPIHVRCDDSVVGVIDAAPAFVRRSRGFTPGALTLAEDAPEPLLAVGGHLKNAFCIVDGRRAFLSPHVGDLDHPAAYEALAEGIAHYERLVGVEPAVVAHDLHPDYLSTRLADRRGRLAIAVQHHHAHVLSCAAEHGITGPIIGVAFDGAGLGHDGAIWGGEFLVADGTRCRRAAHLAYVPLPGGDRAAREPWRMAIAYGRAAGVPFGGLAEGIDERAARVVRQLVDRRSAPLTSSVGRLFDAVAALTGVRVRSAFEGQAALALEAIASGRCARGYGFDLDTSGDPWVLHAEPVIRSIVRDVSSATPPASIAAAFHEALAAAVCDTCVRVAQQSGIRVVALTGGVFQNVRLTGRAAARLSAAGLRVLIHRRVPCNDGGLAVGQAVAAARLLRAGAVEEQHLCA